MPLFTASTMNDVRPVMCPYCNQCMDFTGRPGYRASDVNENKCLDIECQRLQINTAGNDFMIVVENIADANKSAWERYSFLDAIGYDVPSLVVDGQDDKDNTIILILENY